MKRLLPLFGLLFLVAAPSAIAAGDQYADLHPVSPYVQRVVRRVQAGLDAPGAAGTTADAFLKFFWLDRITGAILMTVDTDLRIVEQQRDLKENSPCLRIDTLILEGWMERARKRKNDMIAAGRVSEAARLISIQRYLNNRYKALLLGARDPTYVDEEEGSLYEFDPPPYWCCPGETANGAAAVCTSMDASGYEACTEKKGTAFKRQYACELAGCAYSGTSGQDEDAPCPFASDYLPPTAAGYGCDLSVLQAYWQGPEGIAKEMAGLQALLHDREAFSSAMNSTKETIKKLEERLGGTSENLPPAATGTGSQQGHQAISGCFGSQQDLPEGIAFWDRRGPFSFSPNEIVLMPKLAALWSRWGAERLPPDYLRNSRDLAEGSPEYDWAQKIESGFFFFLFGARLDAQQYLQQFSLRQTEDESTQVARTIDAPLRVLATLTPLRAEVRALASSVQSSDRGLRKFVRNFASFLRMSCVFRPCNEQLDRVLKIIFKDECFPYANGAALEDDVAEQCKKAAGL